MYVGFGDHEASRRTFAPDPATGKSNGPLSEDGASYDPDPNAQDLPTYKENVYYYTYDNVAMIVLNTEYWESRDPMVTHGAVFPNGDHLADAMWWNGDNTSRAVVAGVPLSRGTIERRDEILDICVNGSAKFLAFISGDEHNFSFLPVGPETPIYLDGYTGKRITLKRSFFCINNGAGGSASYAMLASPWSAGYKYFTEPPALALIHVNGESVTLEALRMETFDKICDGVKLR